jgi:pimeloyl-ACP methyl ester carboxylesterase
MTASGRPIGRRVQCTTVRTGAGKVILRGALALAMAAMCAAGAEAKAYRIALRAPGQVPTILYAEEYGRGAPVLLVHGLGASTFTWRHIVPALARSHRVIALDLKGFGRSQKPFGTRYAAADQAALVAAFINKRKLEGVTLVGHSFGGTVALLTALKLRDEPWRIKRLVVIDAPALRQDFGTAAELLRVPGLPYVAMTATLPELMARLLLRVVSAPGRVVPERDIRGYAAPFYDLGSRHAFIATAQAIFDHNTPRMGARYRAIRVPTLIVWCRRDRIVPLKTGRRLARLIPDARLAVIGRCNHLPQDEVPDALLATLRPFLND